MRELLIIVGNRPQYIKLGILISELKINKIKFKILDTGQHYDKNLSTYFFNNFGFEPNYNFNIRSGDKLKIISKIINKLNNYLLKKKYEDILVFGDTNTTVASAIVAAYKNLNLYHIESGERTFYRHEFPEEINRVITDNLSNILFACSKAAVNNLKAEGFKPSRIKFTGDLMYDLFKKTQKKIINLSKNKITNLNLKPYDYCIATIHREENCKREIIKQYLKILDGSKYKTILFAHPRLKKIIKSLNWISKNNLIIHDPVDYFNMMYFLNYCNKVFTDSGGLKREAFFSKKMSIFPHRGKPIWENINLQNCSLSVDPLDFKRIKGLINKKFEIKKIKINEFGDGKSAKKISKLLKIALTTEQNINWGSS